MTDRDNPRAFPRDYGAHTPNGLIEFFGPDGMSLRDWFAGQVVAAWCANPCPHGGGPYDAMSREAYRLADAMLAARKKEKPDAE